MTNIFENHQQEWLSSAVTTDIIDRNVWSMDNSSDVDKLLNLNADKRWKHSEHLVPCWAVAGVDPKTGERIMSGVQVKPDTPVLDPRNPEKKRKYLGAYKSPTQPLFLEMEQHDYWKTVMDDTSIPVVIVEGAKKAGAVLSQGLAAISLPGVSTGGKKGRIKPRLKLYANYGRTIYIGFDRDIIKKRQVRRALHNLGRMLADFGAMVKVLEWDNDHKGIDDWIVATGGQVATLMPDALTLEEWRDQADQQHSDEEPDPCSLARRYKQVESKLKGRVRLNTLKTEIEIDGIPVDFDTIRMALALRYNIQLPNEECYQILNFLAQQNKYSPVAEYLNSVAEEHDADSELLDSLSLKYFGAGSKLHSTYLRKTLIAAVARAFKPGCKVDTVCILFGGQGVGKSSFWRILSQGWFDDSVGSSSDKDERLKLHQSWIIEWAELETAFKRKDVSSMKAFISNQIDQLRPPYGRKVKDFYRPSIIVGTTNEQEILADSTGARRYWIIPIQIEAIPFDDLENEADLIWAAAVHAYRSGESHTLPKDLVNEAQEDNENYQRSDPWEELIYDHIKDKDWVTTSDLLSHAIGMEFDRQNKVSEMRAGSILRSMGWYRSSTRIDGKKTRIWRSPQTPKYISCDVPEVPLGTNSTKSTEKSSTSDRNHLGHHQTPPEQPQALESHSKTSESTLPPKNGAKVELLEPLNPPLSYRREKPIGELSLTKSPLTKVNGSKVKIEVGTVVIPTSVTLWYRKGSQILPKGSFPYGMGRHANIRLDFLTVIGMAAVQEESTVLEVLEAEHKLKIRNNKTGRISTVSIYGCQPMPVEANGSKPVA